MRKLIKNSIMTPDQTVLTSRHRHDFKSHLDKNGELYICDGGSSYVRRSVNIEPYEDLSLYSDDPFEKLREGFEWGTYGKNGDEDLHYKSISNMTTNHIIAIVSQFKLDEFLFDLFNKELAYREELTAKGLGETSWEED